MYVYVHADVFVHVGGQAECVRSYVRSCARAFVLFVCSLVRSCVRLYRREAYGIRLPYISYLIDT